MHIELNLDHIDVIKNECQCVTNILMTFFYEKLPLKLMKKRWKICEKSLLSCEKKYSYVQIE